MSSATTPIVEGLLNAVTEQQPFVLLAFPSLAHLRLLVAPGLVLQKPCLLLVGCIPLHHPPALHLEEILLAMYIEIPEIPGGAPRLLRHCRHHQFAWNTYC